MSYARTETRDHGYPIIAARPAPWSGGRIIVADRGEQSYHRYAVWHEYPDGSCEGGNYLATLVEAGHALTRRSTHY